MHILFKDNKVIEWKYGTSFDSGYNQVDVYVGRAPDNTASTNK